MNAVEGEDWVRAKITQKRTGQDFNGPGAAEAVRLALGLMESGGAS
ncbi:MAG: hypothetical protein U0990_08380 [Candidatus Nanopelagicales bacterium]|nr:hypothetical protein [Candidatus Nanopelagicales bacterium]MDZ4250092.1 hypothetical protein [Candidatus Nanopelagicales bacterium]